MPPANELPRFVFALRRGESGLSQVQTALGVKVAHSADFERSASNLTKIGNRDALLLDHLNVMIVRAAPAEVEAIAQHASFAKWVEAYRPARQSTFRFEQSDDVATTAFDESRMSWGLQATGVDTSPYTGQGVRVAVLDSALDIRHPDFAARLAPTTLETFTGAPADKSLCIHGTAVAGIVAGPVVPSAGPRYGVAPNCELYFGRVGDDNCGYDDSDVMAGIEWAMSPEIGCQIVNLSLGVEVSKTSAPDAIFERLCTDAAAQGVLVVAAGGNHSERHKGVIKPVQEPANCTDVLAVGAINSSRAIASFSPRRYTSGSGDVNLVAPGVHVRTALAHNKAHYFRATFTSFAAPFVTGIAALWLEKEPHLTPAQLWARLGNRATAVGKYTFKDIGRGLVQAPQ